MTRSSTRKALKRFRRLTEAGEFLPVSSVADVEVPTGPTQIHHIERNRAVTLQIQPRYAIPLETAIDTVRDMILNPLRSEGLPVEGTVGLSVLLTSRRRPETRWLAT